MRKQKYSVWLCLFIWLVTGLTPVLAQKGRTRAVVVGVSSYQNPNIPPLDYAHRDAIAFAEYLRSAEGGGLAEEDVKLLTDSSATCGNFATELWWLLEESKEGDKAIIFFSGHGDMEKPPLNYGVLLTHKSPPSMFMGGSALGVDRLQLVVNTLSTQNKTNVFLIVDACHAGELAGDAYNGRENLSKSLTSVVPGAYKILSCQPKEKSHEGPQWGEGHGAFTYYLLKGLRGDANANADYEVTLFEIEEYLEDHVREATSTLGSQIPQVHADDKSVVFAEVNEEALAALQARLKGDGKKELEQSNDSLLEARYTQFFEALESGHLMVPEKGSAFELYNAVKDRPELGNREGNMRRKLVAALKDEAQDALNDYLESDPRELKERWKGSDKYKNYPLYMSTAAELVGEGNFLYDRFLAVSKYFEGLLIRLEAEKTKDKEAYADAEKLQERVLELEANAAYAYNELGLLKRRQGKYDESIGFFKKALDQSPTWVLANDNLCASYLETRDFEKGYKACRDALSHDSTYSSTHHNLGYYYYDKDSPDYKSAERHFRLATKYNPDYANSYYYLGNVLYMQERKQEAKSMWMISTMKDKSLTDAFFNLGEVSMDDFDSPAEAEVWFRGAISADPKDSYAHYRLAVSLAKQGRDTEAVASIEDALKLGFKDKKTLTNEPAFEALVESPDFSSLVSEYFSDN